MAKKIYIGDDTGVARRVKKAYIGNDAGLAKRIRKAYIGIGGVARPCFTGGELSYYGPIDDLSVARWGLAATSAGGRAFFGGGSSSVYSKDVHSTVDVYDEMLEKILNTSPLDVARCNLAATSVGGRALFGGGQGVNSGGSAVGTNHVDAYLDGLTKTPIEHHLSVSSFNCFATSIGKYALFYGGGGKEVDVYDDSLTKQSPISLAYARNYLAAASTEKHAFFGGGMASTYDATVDVFDTSLTYCEVDMGLRTPRERLAAAPAGKNMLFAGGRESGGYQSSAVDAYGEGLTRGIAPGLTFRYDLAATSVGDFALFGGGYRDGAVSTVESYDDSLTSAKQHNLYCGRCSLAATSVGDFALFGGGGPRTGGIGGGELTVDAYTI